MNLLNLKNIIFGSLILLAFGCEKSIDLELQEGEKKLVVEGLITDEPGPYQVKLTQTAAYTQGTEGINLPIKGAIVNIFDDLGNSETLLENSNGIYKTQDFQGKVGVSYWITISTPDDESYESLPEKMLPTPPIEDLYYEFKQESDFNVRGHEVFVDLKDPADERNFYRWTYEGYFRFPTDLPVFPLDTCCSNCFLKVQDRRGVSLLSDLRFDGNEIKKHPVMLIPYTSPSRYLLNLKQLSLTQEAFAFWENMENQSKNVGTIFDAPPTPIKGNINHVNNPNKVALGYFGASATYNKQLMLVRGDAPSPPKPRVEFPFGDCRNVPNSTLEVPEGWKF